MRRIDIYLLGVLLLTLLVFLTTACGDGGGY
jgi:hypothetical protein